MRGVVPAGHPLTAEAGADVLSAGGNAVDAAVAAVLMSWVAEAPLTGTGAGGFMLVHTADGAAHRLDGAGRGRLPPRPPRRRRRPPARLLRRGARVRASGPAAGRPAADRRPL